MWSMGMDRDKVGDGMLLEHSRTFHGKAKADCAWLSSSVLGFLFSQFGRRHTHSREDCVQQEQQQLTYWRYSAGTQRLLLVTVTNEAA